MEASLLGHLDLICCPRCRGALANEVQSLRCTACDQEFEVSGGIPLLFWPNEWESSKGDVTEVVKAFYEETPFPNYDELDDVASLIGKASKSGFAKLLDEQVPTGARILECGCGTGQMSNFLSVASRTVFATDVCLNALRLGHAFKMANALHRVHFLQMNLFRPVFKPGTFDLVVCNGVLHHTSDPLLGFSRIGELLRPGGYILVGLYNRYGRLITDIRRFVFRSTGDRLTFLDPNLRRRRSNTGDPKRRAWFMDQYKHPHESKHSIGQVLGWLRTTGFQFVCSIPNSIPFRRFTANARLFEPQRPGTWLERAIVELGMIPRGSREGGFFIVIGRK